MTRFFLSFLIGLSAAASGSAEPPKRHAVRLFVYSTDGGKTIDCTRLGSALREVPSSFQYHFRETLPLHIFDLKTGETCEAGDFLTFGKPQEPYRYGTLGTHLRPGTNEIYLASDYEARIFLGTVKLPLQDINEIELSAKAEETIEEVRGLYNTGNMNHPSGCSVYELTLDVGGAGFKPWTGTGWSVSLGNELFDCSNIDNLSGSWGTPRLRWFVRGYGF